MRTSRSVLAGAAALILLASLSVAVTAQPEQPGPITFVTGWVWDMTVHTEVRDREDEEPGPPTIVRGYEVTGEGGPEVMEQRVDWSDPRLPTEHWLRMEHQMVTDPTGEPGWVITATSHLLVDHTGSWSGTGRLVESHEGQYSFVQLTGEGAYEGLHALLWGPRVRSPGPVDIAYEGYIIEGDLLAFPEAPIPVATEPDPME